MSMREMGVNSVIGLEGNPILLIRMLGKAGTCLYITPSLGSRFRFVFVFGSGHACERVRRSSPCVRGDIPINGP